MWTTEKEIQKSSKFLDTSCRVAFYKFRFHKILTKTKKVLTERPMGLVNLLVGLNHLPYGIMLSFMDNGHVADVKHVVVHLNVLVYLYPFTPQSALFHLVKV